MSSELLSQDPASVNASAIAIHTLSHSDVKRNYQRARASLSFLAAALGNMGILLVGQLWLIAFHEIIPNLETILFLLWAATILAVLWGICVTTRQWIPVVLALLPVALIGLRFLLASYGICPILHSGMVAMTSMALGIAVGGLEFGLASLLPRVMGRDQSACDADRKELRLLAAQVDDPFFPMAGQWVRKMLFYFPTTQSEKTRKEGYYHAVVNIIAVTILFALAGGRVFTEEMFWFLMYVYFIVFVVEALMCVVDQMKQLKAALRDFERPVQE